MANPVMSYEVYHWPEFKAFAERLGIIWDAPTTDLNIFLPVNGIPVITHEYYGDELFNVRRRAAQQKTPVV